MVTAAHTVHSVCSMPRQAQLWKNSTVSTKIGSVHMREIHTQSYALPEDDSSKKYTHI